MIYWKVSTAILSVASMRYRAALPFEYLVRRGYSCKFLFPSSKTPSFAETDFVVFVKSFTKDDVRLAKKAAERNATIVLDLCDNIFVPKYSGWGATAEYFIELANLATAIITTGSALEKVVEKMLGRLPKLFIVPDGFESSDDLAGIRHDLYLASKYELATGLVKRTAAHLLSKRMQFLPFMVSKIQDRLQRAANTQQSKLAFQEVRTGRSNISRPASENSISREPYQLLWFGNHGAPYARFGIVDIFDIRMELEQVAKSIPLVLNVVSNNYEAYVKYIKPLAIDTRYYEWYPGLVQSLLKDTAVVLIPNSRDEFSICKSANRAILALSNDVPVVASSTPAMEIFRQSCFLDDWIGGIHTYCNEPEVARAHTQAARRIIANHFLPDRIADSWENILNTCTKTRADP